MNPDKLVRMANRIGDFFAAMPDREAAAADVATHIRRTWAPQMRAALLAHVAANGDGELNEMVRAALPRLGR
jgi:formate dehydrogenase subunit delta